MKSATHWWHGLLARSLMAVVGIALLMGGASSVLVSRVAGERAYEQAMVKLDELLDTVESTATIAAFVGDEQLAKELAQGLMRNSEVLRVTIRGNEHGNERELARAERAPPSPAVNEGSPRGTGGMKDPATGAESNRTLIPSVKRQLYSPFTPHEAVGEIRLDADRDVIDARMANDARFISLLLAGQLALVIAAAAAAMLFLVVRPIKATSDRLHRLDAAKGERLAVPESHARSELGRLVEDINNLTARLVATIGIESDLLRQQVIDQRKYQDLFENAAFGIFVADHAGRLESFNLAYASLTWLSRRKEAAGRWLTEAGWANPEQLLVLLRNSLNAADNQALEEDFLLIGQRKDERWLHVAVTPLGNGSVQGIVTDVTQRRSEEISARQLAVTDALTGFANRSGLQNALSGIGPDTPPFALVMIDLDGFRRINDAMGFQVGDQLLMMVAARIRKLLEDGDRAARVGGDEFALVLAGERGSAAIDLRVGQLLQLIGQAYDVNISGGREEIDISASAGIAFFPSDGADLHELLRSTELALNSVQASGGRKYCYFDLAQQTAVEHRRRLEDDLRHALDGGELHLVFQPVVDLASGQPVGAEALLRWSHPVRGLVSPEVFIPLAEDLGLIGEIGLMVLDEACRQVAAWRKAGLDLSVSVNVSVRQIPEDLPPLTVATMLKQHGLPPTAVAIEITEGVLMNNVAVAQSWIEYLRADGMRVYLDDFGTGYSSLSYLKRFALDTVKIDKSFVRDMSEDNNDRALVDAIVTMARSLGLQVIAEGIETQAQLDILRQMGCGYGQGYFFSKPVKADEFVTAIAKISAVAARG
ncbi:MAG: bifunctional diguanylate cyclase/phosphodiesterase [Rhodocyclaceae bacterium]|nr:bifunctional diguanylate cyclase/phosphodiesterase [Rhodocyclaceae bacterium]